MIDTLSQTRNKPMYDARQYNFPAQVGSGSLSIGSNVIQFSVATAIPQGLAANRGYLYISGGTGTAEAVPVTAVGASSVTVTCANTHSGAWTIQSATAGAQEAWNVAMAAGGPFSISLYGNPVWRDGLNCGGASNATLFGNGAVIDFRGARNNGYVITNSGSLGSQTTVSSNVNNGGGTILTDTTRAFKFTNTVNVTSAAGMAIGGYLRLYYDDSYKAGGGSQAFSQVVKIANLSGTTVTTDDPVVIPVNTNTAASVSNVSLISNVVVRDLVIDGTNMTATDVSVVGFSYWRDSTLSNVTLRNFLLGPSAGGGIASNIGLNNTFHDISLYKVNTQGAGADFYLTEESGAHLSNIRSRKGSFGPEFVRCTQVYASNVSSLSSTGRAVKITGLAHSQFANCEASYSSGSTGFSVQGGSYQNLISNLSAKGNLGTNGWGVDFTGQGNIYNIISGCSAFGNNGVGAPDVVFGSVSGYLDQFNTINGLLLDQSQPSVSFVVDQASTNLVNYADQFLPGTASSGAVTVHSAFCQITTESLTTAAGSSYTLTLTNNRILGNVKSPCVVNLTQAGSNNQGLPVLQDVSTSSLAGSVTIRVHNFHASQAFNGTLVLNVMVTGAS